MALPRIAEVGNLLRDPELRFTPGGSPVLDLGIAFNSRKFNRDTKEWEDDDTLFVNGSLWGDKAEAVAEAQLKQGDRVMISGRLRTESWEKDGVKQSKVALLVDDVATVVRAGKTQRSDASSGGGDPWGGKQDDPPF